MTPVSASSHHSPAAEPCFRRCIAVAPVTPNAPATPAITPNSPRRPPPQRPNRHRRQPAQPAPAGSFLGGFRTWRNRRGGGSSTPKPIASAGINATPEGMMDQQQHYVGLDVSDDTTADDDIMMQTDVVSSDTS